VKQCQKKLHWKSPLTWDEALANKLLMRFMIVSLSIATAYPTYFIYFET